ncbi:glycosyltransferase family 4 protein [Brasilonema octagenarum]|uniref:Glycosyl transferase n=1 Tax=Brasilonema octagenarum UFV-OR1 TaxID=417115 RepID=A0ABX1M315_9CYAN|nr:glycosyltransferase family 4 protein [Brasilonema octagenarum]NMF61966.1 glycosyl transferase [Brasilonema octagenarum UFV-OR1]
MTKYHIVLHRSIDLEKITTEAESNKCPRHVMWILKQRLNASIHTPSGYQVSFVDKLLSKIAGSPEYWAMARALSSRLESDDIVFCNSEAGGIQVATLCGFKRNRPKIAVFFHNIDRPRGRLALKLFNLASKIDLFLACSKHQVTFLRDYLNLPASRVHFVWDQTDLKFFAPKPASAKKSRPMIASVGLEQRDYRTLAAATANLDIDVKISGFSNDALLLKRAFPEKLPRNMSRRFYEWPELVQLYRDADIIVVSIFENSYAAGIQALMEAMACRRPVIVTHTLGLDQYIAETNAVMMVKPEDVEGLKQAIIYLLNNPQEADALAERGYQLALSRHNSDHYVNYITKELKQFEVEKQVRTQESEAISGEIVTVPLIEDHAHQGFSTGL